MTYVGIDPGLGGGLAALSPEGRVLMATAMPRGARELVDLLIRLPERSAIVLESVHAMPRHMTGGVGNFKLGHNHGMLEGVLAAFNFEVEAVAPIKWMSALGCRTKGDKTITRRRAAEMFPQIRVTHATADALLLAEYCRRRDVDARKVRVVFTQRRR